MWAKNFESCVVCGRSDRPHMAKGFCSACYSEKYKIEHLEKTREQKRKWYIEHGGASKAKLDREERWFSGKRDAILQRDEFRCKECGEADIKNLVVHHIDGNGRGSENPNNEDENLVTLCRKCHAKIHSTITRWSRKFDHCQECGRTDRKHNAKGLCWYCYSKFADDVVRPHE